MNKDDVLSGRGPVAEGKRERAEMNSERKTCVVGRGSELEKMHKCVKTQNLNR